MISYIKKFFPELQGLSPSQKKNIIYIAWTLFFILFSYALIRSTVDAIFLDIFGAQRSPHVWVYSIAALSIVVMLYNKYQNRFKIHVLYLYTSIFTFVFLSFCILMIAHGQKIWAYPLYVWKEVYVMLLLHIAFGYMNTMVDFRTAKILYGPIGAANGLAGVMGGLLTSYLTYYMKTEWILMVGNVAVLVSFLSFWKTEHKNSFLRDDKEPNVTPFKSIADVKVYVFWMVVIMALSQFCINLANFRFYVLFDALVADKLMKARYLGHVNSAINGLSLVLQLLAIPFIFKYTKNKTIHKSIPVLYLVVAFMGLGVGGNFLLPVMAAFVVFKGVDYSIFSTAKEMFYFPLNDKQKYGSKYVVDVIVYRLAKGIISFLLIFVQNQLVVNILLYIFLFIWFLSLFPLFRQQKIILDK